MLLLFLKLYAKGVKLLAALEALPLFKGRKDRQECGV